MSNASNVKRSLKSAKSRGGCQRCKAKRIKCDETKPACNICLANGVPCPGFTKPLRWSNKHEVFRPLPANRSSRTSENHSDRKSSADSSGGTMSQLIASDTTTQGEDMGSGVSWDDMDMSEMLEWPNFEFCGFNDLGLSTPVMAQETNAELEAMYNTSVSSSETDTSPQNPVLMDGLTAPFAPLSEHPLQREPTEPVSRGNSQSVPGGSDACTDSVSLLQSFYRLSMPSAVPGFSDQDFVHHYFNNICTIYSCFDSDMNPFRTYVSEQWSDCRTTYLAIQAMSASHLANFYPHMAPVGLAKRSQAWLALQRDLRNQRESNPDRVLLCLLLLGLSSTWHQSSNLGLEYLFAARDIVQKKIRSSQGVGSIKDEFFLNALMHWEMLASFVDPVPLMPLSGLKSPEPRMPRNEGPKMPHPWTGPVKELHFVMAEIGRVLRRQRYLAATTGLSPSRREALRDQDEEWMTKLERMLISVPTLEPDDVVDYHDQKTPKSDLIRVTEAYRYVGLLEIYNAYPPILQRRISQDAVPDNLAAVIATCGDARGLEKQLTNIAYHVLETIKPIFIVSGACRLLPLVLVACAGHIRLPSRTSSPDGAESNSRRDEVVEARYFIEARMMTLSRKYPQKPMLQMMEVVKEIWQRLDAGTAGAHWMDVAHENGWQTMFG